ncbi:MAG: gas vesicle protein GvpO [Nanoarchaeota archaeon]
MNLFEIQENAVPQIRKLLNKEPEGISLIEKTNDGWRVLCDVLDKKSIPETYDILKVFEFMLDKDAKVTSFKLLKKIRRGDIGDSD